MIIIFLANSLGLLKLVKKKRSILGIGLQTLHRSFMYTHFRRWFRNYYQPPEELTIVASDQCNLRCKMCQYSHTASDEFRLNRVGMMPLEMFKKIIDEVSGNPYICFTGGEPLLNSDLHKMVAYANKKKLFTMIVTNGWFLEQRAEELLGAGLDTLFVSVDGLQEVHNEIRGKKSFEHLAAGVKKVISLPGRPIVILSMAVSNHNYTQLVDLYELALKWKVDGLNYNHLWIQADEMVESHNRCNSLFKADTVPWEINPDDVDVNILADSIDEVRRRNRLKSFLVTESPYMTRKQIATWYYKPSEFVKWDSTRCGWIRMKIWPDGKIKPCRGWEAGNVANQHVMSIWNNKKYQDFRMTLWKHGVIPICSRCCYFVHR